MATKSASWATWKPLVLSGALVLAAGTAGCGAIDDALFSGSTMEAPPGEEGAFPDTVQSDDTGTAATPGAFATDSGSTVKRIPVAGGEATGTAVSQQAQQIRGTVMSLQDRIEANGQRLAVLRASEAASAASYNSSKSVIASRLQLGTTRGNPELVAQWNTAQDSLDRIAADINALNALGTDVGADEASANFTLSTIRGLYGVSGAVDEDHRQLAVLEDETSQSIVLLERLLTSVGHDVQRATSYVANERSNLTVLANAIKNGEIYGDALGPSMMAAQPPAPSRNLSSSLVGGTPLVVIKFDKPNVEYQQILYTALAQALERKPEAGFQVVAVAPTAGSPTSLQLAQSQTQRNAKAVLRSMSDMGVPASRLALSSTTDPGVQSGEVRVYIR